MKIAVIALAGLSLAACGHSDDRLTDAEAMAEQNAVIETPNIIAPPAPAGPVAAPGTGPELYKAVGTEPGWALSVRADRIEYLGDYGEVRIGEPTPAGFRPVPGRTTAGRLVITIAPGPCSDGMSDLVYRQKVTVVADGKTVSGCGGGTVAPDGLAGTNWTVAAINGRPTPGGPRYYLKFEGERLSAAFGCNSLSGGYRLNGDHLATSDLIGTQMACGEPAMSNERQGAAILSSNVRVERIDGTRIRLISEAGSIELKRAI